MKEFREKDHEIKEKFQDLCSEFASLIDSIDDLVCSRDLEGALVVWNNAFAEFIRTSFGIEPYVGMKAMEYHPPDQQENFTQQRELFQRVIAGEKIHSEFSYTLPNGETNHFEITWSPIWQAEKVIGFAELIRNITKQREIENKLRKNEEKLRAFIQNSSEGIWSFDFEPPLPLALPIEEQLNLTYDYAKVSEANDTVARMYGYEKGNKLIGLGVEDFLPRSDPDSIVYLENLIRHKFNKINWESVEYTRDGEKRNFTANIVGIIEDGLLKRIWGTSRDITDQVKAQEELMEAEQRYRTVADYTYDWEYWEHPDGTLKYVSPSCERITGYKAEEFMDEPGLLQEIIFPEYRDCWLRCQQDMLIDKKPRQMQFKIQAKNGNHVWIEHAGQQISDESGEYLGYRASNRDITKRKKIFDALQKSERDLKKAQQIAHLGFLDWDLKTNQIHISDEIVRLFGLNSETVYTTPELVSSVVHPDDLNFVQESLELAIKGEKKYDIDHRIVRPDGTVIWVYSQAELVCGGDGLPERLVGTAIDITERKKGEKELQQSQKDLRHLTGRLLSIQEEERRRLARELHDDLAQRLAILAIDFGRLKIEANCSIERAGVLQSIQDKLIKISEDVHSISRQLHPSIIEDLGLEDALRSEINNFSRQEGIPVTFETSHVSINPPLDIAICLFRVTQESLRNIRKHSRAKTVTIQLIFQNGSLLLKISDDGRGFDPKEVRKLPGLGLKSMRERIRLVNGSISYTSQPGMGTKVEARVEIPSAGVQ